MVSIRRVVSVSLVGALVMVAWVSELQATPAQDAQQFVENFADWAIEEIIKPKLSDTERALSCAVHNQTLAGIQLAQRQKVQSHTVRARTVFGGHPMRLRARPS